MGLDQYAYKKHYVKNWESQPEETKTIITVTQCGKPYKNIDTSTISELVCEIGYWRKANQIHGWIVDNVQGGEDDCKEYEVDAESAAELLDLINEVLADHSKAVDLLPCTPGFFFGGEEYDEYYFEQLEYTKTLLEQLKAGGDMTFYYQSSW